jgi:acyl carrier protein
MEVKETQYADIFCSVFEVEPDQLLPDLAYQDIENWDSVGHMALMAALEDEFTIELDIDDIIDFSSYQTGKTLLRKYEINVV